MCTCPRSGLQLKNIETIAEVVKQYVILTVPILCVYECKTRHHSYNTYVHILRYITLLILIQWSPDYSNYTVGGQ